MLTLCCADSLAMSRSGARPQALSMDRPRTLKIGWRVESRGSSDSPLASFLMVDSGMPLNFAKVGKVILWSFMASVITSCLNFILSPVKAVPNQFGTVFSLFGLKTCDLGVIRHGFLLIWSACFPYSARFLRYSVRQYLIWFLSMCRHLNMMQSTAAAE